MKIIEDVFEFDFPQARKLFKFDEKDKGKPHYHIAQHCMKAVDIVAEFDDCQLWIEVKNFPKEHLDSFASDPIVSKIN